jgi:hypothetical protein
MRPAREDRVPQSARPLGSARLVSRVGASRTPTPGRSRASTVDSFSRPLVSAAGSSTHVGLQCRAASACPRRYVFQIVPRAHAHVGTVAMSCREAHARGDAVFISCRERMPTCCNVLPPAHAHVGTVAMSCRERMPRWVRSRCPAASACPRGDSGRQPVALPTWVRQHAGAIYWQYVTVSASVSK